MAHSSAQNQKHRIFNLLILRTIYLVQGITYFSEDSAKSFL